MHTTILSQARYGGTVRRTVLDNGLRIITEALPSMRSASFGIYVNVGSRDEPDGLHGAAHFLEHLLYKGTEKRSAWDITSEIEVVGGDTNAFTTKEYTCFYARVLDQDLPLAVDVICDMITRSTLPIPEMELERGVVVEEIAMTADEPEDLVHDLFSASLFGAHPLGRPILGGATSIEKMSRDALYAFYRYHYQPANMVVSAAGNIDHDAVVRQIEAAFAPDIPVISASNVASLAVPRAAVTEFPKLTSTSQHKETEQVHVVLGRAGIDRYDERRYALNVLAQVLGGGMSSRLFQEVRERRGLAYSVYAFDSQYADAGHAGVYAGCAPQKTREVLEVLQAQLDLVAKDGLTELEVQQGISMLNGATVLGLEDTGSRMTRIARDELLYGEFMDIDELLLRTKKVTAERVAQLAQELFSGSRSVNIVGPVANGQMQGAS